MKGVSICATPAHGGGTAWQLIKGHQLILFYTCLEASQGVTTGFPHIEENSWQKRVDFLPKQLCPRCSGRQEPKPCSKGLGSCAAAAGPREVAVSDAKKGNETKTCRPVGVGDRPQKWGSCKLAWSEEGGTSLLFPGLMVVYTHGVVQGHFLGWITVGTVSAESPSKILMFLIIPLTQRLNTGCFVLITVLLLKASRPGV